MKVEWDNMGFSYDLKSNRHGGYFGIREFKAEGSIEEILQLLKSLGLQDALDSVYPLVSKEKEE